MQQNQSNRRIHYNNAANSSRDERQSNIRDRKPYVIGYSKIKQFLDNHRNNPNALLIELSGVKSFLELITDDNTLKGWFGDYGFLCMIIEILAIICDSEPDILLPFMAKLCATNFHNPIQSYLSRIHDLVIPTARDPDLHIATFDNLVKFVRQMQQMIPQSSRDKIKILLFSLNDALEKCNKKHDVIKQSTFELLKLIKNENESAINSSRFDEKANKIHKRLPPNDFRKISIFPTYEDIHVTNTPFLRSNHVKGKYLNVDDYLDIQFRLLREDYVRPLREGIQSYLNAIKDNDNVITKLKDIRVYTNVRIISSQLKEELIFEAQFDVSNHHHINWKINNRLINGSLLCLSYDNFETFCFATVWGQRIVENLEKGIVSIKFETQSVNEEFNKINPLLSLTMVESQAYFESYRHNLQALQTFNSENFPLQEYIISVSNMVQNLPYLNPNTAYDLTDLAYPLIKISDNRIAAIKEKHYALQSANSDITIFDTFKSTVDIDSLRIKQLESVQLLDNLNWPECGLLGFDESQYKAFKAALTQQMVIIQGPPGTGKTYIGLRIVQTLLRNSKHWNGERIGVNDQLLFQRTNHKPILIVCFTNHALDQFLEGMIPFCNENRGIVRIGRQSKNEILQSYTLLELKNRVKFNNRLIPESLCKSLNTSRIDLEKIQKELSDLQYNINNYNKKLLNEREMSALSRKYEWTRHLVNQLRHYDSEDMNLALILWLSERSTFDEWVDNNEGLAEVNDNFEANECEILDDMLPNDDYEDSFTLKLNKKQRRKFMKLMKNEFMSNDVMTDEEIYHVLNYVRDISHLSHKDRWRFYMRCVNVYCQGIQKEMEKLHHEYSDQMRKYNRLKLEEDLCLIRGCDVIGMTTTGSAKYRSIIEKIDPSVVVIEEAAEVLESHVITSLTKSTNHLILIGDHQQLKPNPNVYELAKKYHLDVSLFERMINNGMPYYQLKLQHRMRPCISSLIVKNFYNQLRDHESVKSYENIKGISKNMYFLNHNEMESYYNESQSKFNEFEANFVVYLCKYLIQQQYKPSQITIIVMYSAQFFKIKNLLKEYYSLLNGVRVTVIDDYQGEENDIIILSFVRSNIEGSIGFLQVSNRVNVALSRARMALYGIGNFDCLADTSDLWKNIIKALEDEQAFGTQLEIYCQNHTTTKTLISKASDFLKAPEGGCNKRCEYRLDCGHVCPIACHVYDSEHESVKCTKLCNNPYDKCDHKCVNTCHIRKSCAPCKVKVVKTIQTCGHQMSMFCSDNPLLVTCCHKCERMLSCGHNCKNLCGFVCNPLECDENVRILSQCGHEVDIRCSQKDNSEKLLSICTEDCGSVLKCGHICGGSCGKCQQNRLHVKCQMKCSRVLVCGHICKAVCGDNCPPCREKCRNRCYHSKCKRKCGEPCARCKEPCKWICIHQKCTQICSEKCDRELCVEPCDKKLKCGHSCIGICGEICPNKCRFCNKEEVEEIFFGYEDEPNARFIQLVDCNHVIELNGMLEWLSKSEHITAEDSSHKNNSAIQMKSCPHCKTIIRRTKLFNSPIQESLRDIELVKIKLFGNVDENNRTRNSIIYNMEKFLAVKDISVWLISNTGELLKNKVKNLLDITKTNERKSQIELNIIKTKFDIIFQLTDVWKILSNSKKNNISFADIDSQIDKTDMRIEKLIKFIDTLVNNEQQIYDLQNEMKFIQFSIEIIKVVCDRYFGKQESKSNLIEAFKLLSCLGPLSEEKKNEIKALVEKANKLQCGLGVSFEEKEMIVKAMDFSRGHWYKCPNGHPYCIGECGGAMQQSKCPDCNATIGGSDHRLLSDNAVATEMDGSTQPAYGPHVQIDWQRWLE